MWCPFGGGVDITEQLAKQAIYQTTKYTRAEIKEIIRYSASAVTLHDHEFACRTSSVWDQPSERMFEV